MSLELKINAFVLFLAGLRGTEARLDFLIDQNTEGKWVRFSSHKF